MGWVSYLEDIVERLTDDLRSVDEILLDQALPEPAKLNALLDWHAKAQRVLLEMNRNMDVATDPSMDLAAEVFALERRKKDLTIENSRLSAERQTHELELGKLRTSISQLKTQIDTLKGSLKEEKKRNTKLQDALSSDPTLLYEKYTAPDRLKRLKKDDD